MPPLLQRCVKLHTPYSSVHLQHLRQHALTLTPAFARWCHGTRHRRCICSINSAAAAAAAVTVLLLLLLLLLTSAAVIVLLLHCCGCSSTQPLQKMRSVLLGSSAAVPVSSAPFTPLQTLYALLLLLLLSPCCVYIVCIQCMCKECARSMCTCQIMSSVEMLVLRG
jgi:hypothetical protein